MKNNFVLLKTMNELVVNSADILEKSDNKCIKQLKRSLSSCECNEQKALNKTNQNIIDELREKNFNQFTKTFNKNNIDFEKYENNYKLLEEENCRLKQDLEYEKRQTEDLAVNLKKVFKELDEFKRINEIQENCIETSESEILRLRECLKVSEIRLQETVEISEVCLSTNITAYLQYIYCDNCVKR